MCDITKVFTFFVFTAILVYSCTWGIISQPFLRPNGPDILVESTVIQNKILIFVLPSIKPKPIETKIWPNTINLFLWCQKSNFWRIGMGGSQLGLYKFPRAQPVYPCTAGKLYCLWCWSLKVSTSLGKFIFWLCYFLFLTKFKKREKILSCVWYFSGQNIYMIFPTNLTSVSAFYTILLCVKSEYLWVWGDF